MTMPANILYSIISKKENAHDYTIYCCDWIKSSSSGNSANAAKDYIVTGSLDSLVKVWTLQNNKLELLHTLEGHTMGVVSVAISPKTLSIVSASLDSHLILWDLISSKKITEIPIGESDTWKVVFSPDGDQIATGGNTGEVYVYGVQDGEIYNMLDTRGTFILSIDWSPNGKYIATGSVEGFVCIIDVQQGKVMHTIEAHSEAIRGIAFSPSSNLLATASNDGFVKMYVVDSAEFKCKLEHKSWAVSVCFTKDGTRVATGAADGSVRVALSQNLTLLNTFNEHDDTVWGVRFDSSNRRLMSVSKDKSINLYECPPPPKQQ